LHTSAHAAAWYSLSVSLNGMPLCHTPLDGGIGGPLSSKPIPNPSVLVLICSDKEGYFGAQCPSCTEYFRVNGMPENMCCPYCGKQADNLKFLTDNQRKYILAYVDKFDEMLSENKDITIDFDQIIKTLPSNQSPFSYQEQRQQTHTICDKCKYKFDIFGMYGFCHNCGRRNSLQILLKKLDEFKQCVEHPKYDNSEKSKLETEWENIVKNCVSEFESFGRDIQGQLVSFPATPKRRKQIREISFQRPLDAGEKLSKLFDIELFFKIKKSDKDFVNKQFHRRHLITHNGGLVDQDYIDKTCDTSVKIGEKIRVKKSNAKHLIELTRQLSNNLFDAYQTML